MHAGARVGGGGPIGHVDDGAARAALDDVPAAALGPRMLREDRGDGAPALELDLDDLPVALVAAVPHAPAILRFAGVEHPVLEPDAAAAARDAPAVDDVRRVRPLA